MIFELDSFARFKGLEAPTLFGTIRCHAGKSSDVNPKLGEQLRNNEAVFTVRFVLRRSGYARLFGFEASPIFSNAKELSETDKAYFYAQSYIFLKDMVHRHRHHSDADDTFVEMQNSSPGWKKRIAYQLMKRVIRRPINGDPDSFQDATGILSYLNSYQNSLSINVFDVTNLDMMRQSFSAEHTKLKDRISDMRWIYTVLVGTVSFTAIRFIDWDAETYGYAHYAIPIFLFLLALYFMNKTRIIRYDENHYFLDFVTLYSTGKTAKLFIWGALLLSLALAMYLWQLTPLFTGED